MIRPTSKLLLVAVLFLLCGNLRAQLAANFTIDDTAGCAPMVVHFTNTSTGATSYSWNLGNGTITALTDASGSYVTAGTYTITLTAYNGSSSNTRTATIKAYALPVVNFFASDTTVCPGTNVLFTSTTVAGSWGALTYNWNFGDGLSSTAASPTHAYPASGSYNASLFATNGKGCINSRSKAGYMTVFNTPSVGFTLPTINFCSTPASASFTNTTIGIAPFTSAWRFGDGGTSALLNPAHTYTAPGVFSINLKVTDGNGCADSAFYPAYITVGDMTASFTGPAAGCLNVPVPFANTSTPYISCMWNYGDGTIDVSNAGLHTYTATGTYNVALMTFDGTCYDTVIHPISIQHPTGTFAVTPARPCVPPVALTLTATAPSGSTVDWYSLIRGHLGAGTPFTHTFPFFLDMAGNPIGEIDSFTMIITSSIGCKDTVGKRDTMNALFISMGPGEPTGCTPLSVALTATAVSSVYDPFMGAPWFDAGFPPPPVFITNFPYPYPMSTYNWDFGDGTPHSTLVSPIHIYTLVGGVYTPSVTVVSSNGCTANLYPAPIVMVGSPPPTPSFTLTPTRVCAGQGMTATATATGVFDKYLWDWGDGNSDLNHPVVYHVYTVPGIYQADLKTSYNGCHSTHFVAHDTVDSPSAVMHAIFDCNPRTEKTFRDWSYGDDTHLWDFGDGATSTAANPVHNYPSLGVYTARLTTYNIRSGCRDTVYSIQDLTHVRSNFITIRPALCRDVADTFIMNESSLPFTDSNWIVKYKWYADGAVFDTVITLYPFDTVARAFHSVGNHSVMLQITENNGCLDTFLSPVLVAKPVDSFNFTPISGCAPLLVNLTDHTTDVPGIPVRNYAWTFGDGRSGTSTVPTIAHIYSTNSTFTLKEVVTDSLGCMDSLVSSTRLVVSKPRALFGGGPNVICARRSVHFINSTLGTYTSLWFFGDGDTSTATAPVHAYSTAGTYSVTLVVTNPSGCTDTLVGTNFVTVRPIPVPSFYMDDSFAVCAPFNVNFHNGSTGATSYLWSFGDGTSSSSPNPSDVYIRPGFYRVRLTANNGFGCTDTAIGHVNLFGYAGAFNYTPDSGCHPLSVHFTTSVPTTVNLVWDFADGVTTSPSFTTSISHTYSVVGAFVPKLILADTAGCTAFSIGVDTIRVDDLVADFTVRPNAGCPGNPIIFHDTSSSHFSPIATRTWTFAPGVTATGASPTYSYSTAGTYPVTLSLSDTWGCTSTITKMVTVNGSPAPITGPSVICIGSVITYTNGSTGGTWTSSNPAVASVGSPTGIVTGLSLGVTTLTYSAGVGCSVTKTVTVNPALTPTAGPVRVCLGATTTLSNPTPGGTWASGTPATATLGSATGLLTGILSGTVPVIYTVGGCNTIAVATVQPLPAAITGNMQICIGTSSILSSVSSGGSWTSSTPATATVGLTSGSVLGIVAGTAIITYTLPSTCYTTAQVTINPSPPPIAGGSFVCIGGSTNLTDGTPGGRWSSGSTTVATVGSVSGIVFGVSVGTATISYNAGGCVVTKIVSVDALPPAITGTFEICYGTSTTLSDPISGGAWSSASGIVATVNPTTGSVTGTGAGITTITYNLGSGCVVTAAFTVDPAPANITGTPHACVGASSTMGSLSTGGVWTSGTTSVATIGSTSGVVSGILGGTTVISYVIGSGCAATLVFTVNGVPTPAGLRDMCAWGDTARVIDADTTGIYSSTIASVANLGRGVGLISTTIPGVSTITYRTINGCTATFAFTVNPIPGPIGGPPRICAGVAVLYVDSTPRGGIWSSTDTTIAAIDLTTGMVTAVAAGGVKIIYTLPTGCRVDSSVTVLPVPVPGVITGPSTLCVGQTATYADASVGGVWSVTNSVLTMTGGNVRAITPGTDTIRYTVSNSCGSAIATQIVTVLPHPDAGTISGPESVCVGDTIQLTDATSGGVWSSQNANATVAAGVVMGVTPGADSIIYTFTNLCGTARTAHAMQVLPLADPGVLYGPNAVCVGKTISVSDSMAGGALTLTNGNATLSSFTVTGVAAGQDTIICSATNSCGTVSAWKVITIEPLPDAGNISGPSDLCMDDSITLAASVPGGAWTTAGASLLPENGGTFTGVSQGAALVSYSVTNNCGTTTITHPVTVNPLPSGNSISRNGNQLSVPNGYASYQWTLNGTPIAGAVQSIYTFTVAGTYDVIVTNSFGCVFKFPPIDIPDCSAKDIEIYPNPTDAMIYLQWCKPLNARISCMDGKQVFEVINATQLDISILPSGVYTLTLFDSSNSKLLTKRITKMH